MWASFTVGSVLPRQRATRLIGLFAAELVGLALVYQLGSDMDCARSGSEAACDVLRSLATRALVVLAVLVLLIRARPGNFAGFLPQVQFQDNRAALAVHGAGLVLLLLPLAMGLGGDLSLMFRVALFPWAAGAVLAIGGGLIWFAPRAAWSQLLRVEGRGSLPILMAAAFVPDLANSVLPIWDWQALTNVTFMAVAGFLRLFSPGVEAWPADHIIGIDTFFVSVAPQCSGVEGFALVTAFVAIYAVVFRAEIRPARFLLVILPLGLLLSWLLNVFRIGVLILIGANISPEIAVNGFHSYAGWLLFTLLAFTLVTFVQSVAWLHRAGLRPVGLPIRRDPAAALILPFFTFMVAGTFVSAVFLHPGLGAPLVTFVLGVALALFFPVYRVWSWHPDPLALLAGIVVGAGWVISAPGPDHGLANGLAELPLWALMVWAVARVAGTVIFVPVVEELFFRGYLLGRLSGPRLWQQIAAVVVSSLAFATLHGRWIEAGLAGLVFSGLMLWRGRVADAVWAHVVANAIVAATAVFWQDWGLI